MPHCNTIVHTINGSGDVAFAKTSVEPLCLPCVPGCARGSLELRRYVLIGGQEAHYPGWEGLSQKVYHCRLTPIGHAASILLLALLLIASWLVGAPRVEAGVQTILVGALRDVLAFGLPVLIGSIAATDWREAPLVMGKPADPPTP